MSVSSGSGSRMQRTADLKPCDKPWAHVRSAENSYAKWNTGFRNRYVSAQWTQMHNYLGDFSLSNLRPYPSVLRMPKCELGNTIVLVQGVAQWVLAMHEYVVNGRRKITSIYISNTAWTVPINSHPIYQEKRGSHSSYQNLKIYYQLKTKNKEKEKLIWGEENARCKPKMVACNLKLADYPLSSTESCICLLSLHLDLMLMHVYTYRFPVGLMHIRMAI